VVRLDNSTQFVSKHVLKRYLVSAYAVGTLDGSGLMRLYRPRYIAGDTNKLVCLRGSKVVQVDLDKIVRVVV